MDDIAIGRKEIMRLLGVSWRTIQRHKKADPGFKSLFRIHPIIKKPMLINKEVIQYIIEWNKLKEEQRKSDVSSL
ncbi:MAG: hypothetical protein PHC68_08110 [Syntrophorhabdaceae bacterium]|nr:hypothetical protein [Syntrophorhabdaceae bacterium]